MIAKKYFNHFLNYEDQIYSLKYFLYYKYIAQMSQNSIQSSTFEDEIDTKALINILFESKKLIISSIIIFTISFALYTHFLKPSFKSSVLVELSHRLMPDGSQKQIESTDNLLNYLKINLLYKKGNAQKVSINFVENSLLNFEITSNSIEKNEKILKDFIVFTNKRLSKIANLYNQQTKREISNKIEFLKSELELIQSEFASQSESKRVETYNSIIKFQHDLAYIDKKIKLLEEIIIDDTNNLNLLSSDPQSHLQRVALIPTLDQIIFEYKSQIIELENNKIALKNKISEAKSQLKGLEYIIFPGEMFDLKEKLLILEIQLENLNLQTITQTNTIGDVDSESLKPKILLMSLLGLVLGFIVGIFMNLIRSSIKNF